MVIENNLHIASIYAVLDRGNLVIVAERTPEEALIVSTWPELKSFDTDILKARAK
jgi:hypothetical protein